ncbi:uncharacterized protein LOC134854855 [Symsagittifera roscoffensis]|uniref:uncharacterized protein LOC134854855 n=1 Tax=Symsagittifera roscoffensis TaxID=84072 RepID=UPI00307C31B2
MHIGTETYVSAHVLDISGKKTQLRVTKKYGNLVMCYVDDVVIATPTLEDHIERLEEVFACMKRSGLKCKPSKCEIIKDSIKYLGRMVDRHGIRPVPDAVETVLTWKSPKTEHQLMSFLGFANCYMEFIKGYADKVYPMQQLMRHKGKKFTWNNAAEESFQRIKKELCEAKVSGMPTEKGMYVLDTDASSSNYEIARQVRQTDTRSKEHPEKTILKKTRGMPMGIMLKSKIVRETLKAKGYDLNKVEAGEAQIDEDLMRLLEKLADDKPVIERKGKEEPEVTILRRSETVGGENTSGESNPDGKEIVQSLEEDEHLGIGQESGEWWPTEEEDAGEEKLSGECEEWDEDSEGSSDDQDSLCMILAEEKMRHRDRELQTDPSSGTHNLDQLGRA